MFVEFLNDAAGYMMHDIGPRRFHRRPAIMDNWSRTQLGRDVLPILRRHGLDRRDAYIGGGPRGPQVKTDRGWLDVNRETLASCTDELDRNFAAVAAGVAQERMARLSGWRPGNELPFWAVTASDLLVRHVRERNVTPAQIWNAGVNVDEDGCIDRRSFCTGDDVEVPKFPENDPRAALPDGCYIARYGTGMHLSWRDGDLEYRETLDGAELTLPMALLPGGAPASLIGQSLGSIVDSHGELLCALAGYAITAVRVIEPHPLTLEPEPVRVELHLAVPMRTLKPIPDGVLARAGVNVPEDIERDRPLWMLTDADALRRYRPRLNS